MTPIIFIIKNITFYKGLLKFCITYVENWYKYNYIRISKIIEYNVNCYRLMKIEVMINLIDEIINLYHVVVVKNIIYELYKQIERYCE